MEDIVIYEQANKLFNEFTAILEDNHLSITFEESRNHPYNKSVPIGIGKHSLPPLPYPYDALEPYISEEIMRLHHQKHHQTYVEGLNKSERELQRARQTNNFDLIKHWERELAFHGAGHYLHTIFWNNMSPKGGGMPSGELLTMMEESFGSFRQFKEHFSQAANQVEGSGWAILVWSPRARRLEVLSAEKHQNLSQWDVIPLLALDVWEHAYYLQYKNERKNISIIGGKLSTGLMLKEDLIKRVKSSGILINY